MGTVTDSTRVPGYRPTGLVASSLCGETDASCTTTYHIPWVPLGAVSVDVNVIPFWVVVVACNRVAAPAGNVRSRSAATKIAAPAASRRT